MKEDTRVQGATTITLHDHVFIPNSSGEYTAISKRYPIFQIKIWRGHQKEESWTGCINAVLDGEKDPVTIKDIPFSPSFELSATLAWASIETIEHWLIERKKELQLCCVMSHRHKDVEQQKLFASDLRIVKAVIAAIGLDKTIDSIWQETAQRLREKRINHNHQ